IEYTYQTGRGNIVRTLPNGVRSIWRYHPSGRLDSITHVGRDKNLLAQFTYAYRPDGLVREVRERTAEGERTRAYEYDAVQRLVGVADSRGGKFSYRYDKFGNRTEASAPGAPAVGSDYDWAGRLLRHDGHDCAHDPAGNLTAYHRPGGQAEFAFTADNLLRSARARGREVQYRYDGEGNLVGRAAGGGETSFVPDPASDAWRPLLATGPGGKHTLYVWDGATPLAVISEGGASFFLHDHLGSVAHQADPAGRLARSFDYDPF